jgi:hypothetical protein
LWLIGIRKECLNKLEFVKDFEGMIRFAGDKRVFCETHNKVKLSQYLPLLDEHAVMYNHKKYSLKVSQ